MRMKILKSTFVTVVCLTLLTNCVSIKDIPLSTNELKNMSGKTIVITSREKPDMALMTYNNMLISVLFAVIPGSFWMIHQGNKIVNENNIEDPSVLVASKIEDDLRKQYNLKYIDNSKIEKINSNDVKEISASYRGIADYVLDVETINWNIQYVSASDNIVRYVSHLRLIDVNNSKVIAEKGCTFRPYNRYTKKELLENHAENIKKELTSAANLCVDFYKNNVFNLK